jgi:hypothetical protein
MTQLEDKLKHALQHVEPPAGFANRVLALAAKAEKDQQKRRRIWSGFFATGGLRWAAACVLCVLLAASGALYEHDMQRRRGEAAKEQLMLALRITGSKLQIAQQSLKELDSSNQPRR